MNRKKHTLIVSAALLLTIAVGFLLISNRPSFLNQSLTEADGAYAALVPAKKLARYNASLTANANGTQVTTNNMWIGTSTNKQQSISVFEFRNVVIPAKDKLKDVYLEVVARESTNASVKGEMFILDSNQLPNANLQQGLSLVASLRNGVPLDINTAWQRNVSTSLPSVLDQFQKQNFTNRATLYLVVKGGSDRSLGRRNIYGSQNGQSKPKLVIVTEELIDDGKGSPAPSPIIVTPDPTVRPTTAASSSPTPTTTSSPTPHVHTSGTNSMAMAKWVPNPKFDTCTQEFHDSFSVVGPDGKKYPTWHPPTAVDPKTGKSCTFGHEHGRNPAAYQYWDEIRRGFAYDANKDGQISNEELQTAGIPFGYVNEQVDAYFEQNPSANAFMRHEDHVGHKIEYANGEGDIGDGTDPFDQNTTGGVVVPIKNPSGAPKFLASGIRCYHFQKVHQGVSTGDATTNNLHELIAHTKCESSRPEFPSSTSLTAAMVSFGAPGEFTRFCDNDRFTIVQTGTNSVNQFFPGTRGVGMRNIIDRNCIEQNFLVPDGRFSSNAYELWDAAIKIYTPDGRMLIDNGNGGWEVIDAIRYYYPGAPNNIGYYADLCYETLGNRRMRGGVCDIMTNYGRVKGITWDDPRSGFRGLHRGQYINPHIVNNAGGPTVWYTDPFGRNARTQPFAGSIKQVIPAVNTKINFAIDPRIILRNHDSGNNTVHGPN